MGEKLLSSVTQEVTPAPRAIRVPVGSDWAPAPMWWRPLRRPLDAQAQRMPGRSIGVQWFSIDRKAKTLALDMKLPPLQRPNTTLRVRSGSTAWHPRSGSARCGGGRRCRYPQPDQLQAAGRGRVLSRPAPAFPPRSAISTASSSTALQGTRGQIRDRRRCGAELSARPPSQAPLRCTPALSKCAPPGRGRVSRFRPFRVSWTVRVMAVAWSKDKVGRASAT